MCPSTCRLLRACGAFFIRRTSRGAPDSHLYKAVLAGVHCLVGACLVRSCLLVGAPPCCTGIAAAAAGLTQSVRGIPGISASKRALTGHPPLFACAAYVHALLQAGHSLEFFIEGGRRWGAAAADVTLFIRQLLLVLPRHGVSHPAKRLHAHCVLPTLPALQPSRLRCSRDGRVNPPKLGMLRMVVDAVAAGDVTRVGANKQACTCSSFHAATTLAGLACSPGVCLCIGAPSRSAAQASMSHTSACLRQHPPLVSLPCAARLCSADCDEL